MMAHRRHAAHTTSTRGAAGAGWPIRTDSPTRVTRSCGHAASSWRSSCNVRAVSWSQLDRSDSGMNSDLSATQLHWAPQQTTLARHQQTIFSRSCDVLPDTVRRHSPGTLHVSSSPQAEHAGLTRALHAKVIY